MFYYDRQFKWMEQSVVGRWCPSKFGRTGTQLYDLSGYNNTGTLTNMDPANDWTDEGLDFDGSDDWVGVSPSQVFLQPEMSLTGWVMLLSSANFQYRFGFSTNVFDDYRFSFRTNNLGQTIFYCRDNTNRKTFTSTIPALDTWHFYSLVASESFFVAYLNGSQIGSVAKDPGLNLANAGYSLARQYNRADVAAKLQADDLCIFNRALTPSEVQQLYHAGPGAGLSLSPKRSAMMYAPTVGGFNASRVAGQQLIGSGVY